jgi:hypothetical protein
MSKVLEDGGTPSTPSVKVSNFFKRITLLSLDHRYGKMYGIQMDLSKINSFIWLLSHGKILTAKNLRKRDIVGPSRCALFSQDEESISHLFVHCNYTTTTWKWALGDIF